MTKQLKIQGFRNRLNRNASRYSEHIIANPQFDGCLEDALGLYNSVKKGIQAEGDIIITEGSSIVELPTGFSNNENDNILLALLQQRDPTSIASYYSNLSFGFPTNITGYVNNFNYIGAVSPRNTSYQQGNLSNPIYPVNPPAIKPNITSGLILPYTPANDVTYTVNYISNYVITDDVLNLAFSSLPSNGNSFIVDSATITFISSGTPTSIQVLIQPTLSGTLLELETVLIALGLVSQSLGSSINISNSTGTSFSYTEALAYITPTYTDSIDNFPSSDLHYLYDLMHAKALQGLVAQSLIEDRKINEIIKYSEDLINRVLIRLSV